MNWRNVFRTTAVSASVAFCLMMFSPGVRAEDGDALALASQLQEAFVNVAKQSFPAVVVITNKQYERQQALDAIPPEFRFFFGLPDGPNMRPDPPQKRDGHGKAQPAGKGSGVIVRDTGYIVTNYHVVKDSDFLEVELNDGRIFDSSRDADEVKIVGLDEETDLAVLQIGNGKLKDLPTIPFANSDKIRVGEWAIAVGAPLGLDYSVTIGHVSQIGRHDVGMTTFENYIQTDASINPGNSGGPLLNIKGELIGINEFIMTGGGMSRGSIGLGFAIASNLVEQASDDIVEHGEVVRPFLGISMQPLTDELRKQFGVEDGVLVNEVIEGDPAEKAGVKPGDVVVKVGDKVVRTPHDLLFAVLAYDVGDKIKLHIIRDGKNKEIDVIATQRGKKGSGPVEIGSRQDLLNDLGLALDEEDGTVVIVGVLSGKPADNFDLRQGDRILEVNRQEVKSIKDVVDAFKKTKNNIVVFYIERRGQKFFVGIPLAENQEEEK